ncbi:hypothetical protein ABTY23_00470, partial [Streptomyces sp. NPDC096068]
ATGGTGMEYGGITPVGLPAAWPLLVDAAVVDNSSVRAQQIAKLRRKRLVVPRAAISSPTRRL